MSNERDELAREVFIADNSSSPNPAGEWEYTKSHGAQYPVDTAYAYGIADGLLAAGYRKPRTITTAEELDALPVGSVVLDEDRTAYQRADEFDADNVTDSLWWGHSDVLYPTHWLELPAVVLWEPEA